MNRRAAYRRMIADPAAFSVGALSSPLYPYQIAPARRIYQASRERRTESIVVEISRQAGKNEVSGRLEYQLLAAHMTTGGSIVKCAPTWRPQIVNSKLRLEQIAEAAISAGRLPAALNPRGREGYIKQVGRAQIAFMSAGPNSSVVGGTASILLEVDEAQDVLPAKYGKDFAPMRASTGAPVAFYGTAWTTDGLLATTAAAIEDGREPGQYYRIPWPVVAEHNEAYGRFVESQIATLGANHPIIRTQYNLEPLEAGGAMLTDQQLRQMIGQHERRTARTDEPLIVAGIDIAGADEDANDLASLLDPSSGRDSVVVTIAAVYWRPVVPGSAEQWPEILLLDRYEFQNQRPESTHHALIDILENKWRADRIHCDATGIGATSTAFLRAALRHGRRRVNEVKFDSAWNTHTDLAFQYIAQINAGLLRDHAPGELDPLQIVRQEETPARDVTARAWYQRGRAALDARAGKRVRAHVPEKYGHDDLLISELLCVDAALATRPPAPQRPPGSVQVSAW